MNSLRILNIFKYLYSPHVKVNLGRWNIHNDSETILKIKYANEDNCGLSSNNNNNNNNNNNKNIKQVYQNNELYDDKEYIYMMGYEPILK